MLSLGHDRVPAVTPREVAAWRYHLHAAGKHDGGRRVREVTATRVPVADAVAALARARADVSAHPAAHFWGAAALLTLQLVARGRFGLGCCALCGGDSRSSDFRKKVFGRGRECPLCGPVRGWERVSVSGR